VLLPYVDLLYYAFVHFRASRFELPLLAPADAEPTAAPCETGGARQTSRRCPVTPIFSGDAPLPVRAGDQPLNQHYEKPCAAG